jgi:hypothetical protein
MHALPGPDLGPCYLKRGGSISQRFGTVNFGEVEPQNDGARHYSDA